MTHTPAEMIECTVGLRCVRENSADVIQGPIRLHQDSEAYKGCEM